MRVRWLLGPCAPAAVVACAACSSSAAPALVLRDAGAIPATAAVLCDGSSFLRFAAISGGGNLTGVPRVVAEAGWSLLFVDGQCRYWSATRPDGPVRTGSLTADDAQVFVQSFQLGQWGSPAAIGGCSDAGSLELRFRDQRASVSCISNALTTAYDDWLTSLYGAGTDVTGQVRYTVVDASADGWATGIPSLASVWPLSSDPATVAVSVADESTAEPRIAIGLDADALRTARAAYLSKPASSLAPWLRIPIAAMFDASAPHYFDLAMRDVIPFEEGGRVATDPFFE